MSTLAYDREILTSAARRSGRGATTNARVWAGRIMTTLPALFLTFDGVTKLAMNRYVIAATEQLGFPVRVVPILGAVLLTSLALYLIPRTAVLGAILLTGYLGGAVASNVRVGSPLFSYDLAPIYFAIVLWGGLYLRDARLRALVPFRGAEAANRPTA